MLDPQAQALLVKLTSSVIKPSSSSQLEQTRAGVMDFVPHAGEPAPVGAVDDRTISPSGSEIRLRLYKPLTPASRATIIYFHGGGHVLGAIETVDPICRNLASICGAMVISVGYRLAPEHPFPAGPEDCYAATAWISDHADELGIDAERIFVAGDSAGGNLATGVCITARERNGPALRGQILVYPNTDLTPQFYKSKHEENAEAPFLSNVVIEWLYGMYFTDRSHAESPIASPILAELAGLPPALVITAGLDPLRDEGRSYAARLKSAGVATEHVEYGSLPHGFLMMTGCVDKAREAYSEIAKFVAAASD